MNYRLIILIHCAISLLNPAFSQMSDDFADGDLIQNPAWVGQTNNFVVNANGQLQLLVPAVAGSSYLSTASGITQNAQWSFFIQLNFNPSSSNYADVFLISDKENLQGALNGYFVRIGGPQREVSLYRKDGSIFTKIIDGTDGRVNLNSVELNIKVTKDQANTWELSVDPLLDNSYISEGAVVDGTHTYSGYFGFNCIYTSTRSDKFFFDNILISGDVFTDNSPPIADSLKVLGDSALAVYFNETVESLSAQNVQNYSIDHGIGTPESAVLENNKTVTLHLDDQYMESGTYFLTVNGVADVFGNAADGSVYAFTYSSPFNAGFSDLIITEIMADPSPEIGLPLWEYLEMYSPHDIPLILSGLKLVVGSDTSKIPSISIDARQYMILCQSAAASDLQRYGKTVIIPGMVHPE
ncbi:MAG: Ig-like domain-containing protein [Cyclobacteriaceae bacterium]|nr:Ig-like domain-containing protein [Cyclobacteriaceae bacterium]